jgi:hypothetical protein
VIHPRSPRSPSKDTARGEPVDAETRDQGDYDRQRGSGPVAPARDEPQVLAWLEGATGVRVDLAVVDGLATLTVAGVLDWASLGAVETAAIQMLERSPLRVEFDLREAVCFGEETDVLAARVQAHAHLRRVPFLLSARSRVG